MNGVVRPVLLPPQLDKVVAARYPRDALRVRQDAFALLAAYPTLLPKEDVLVTNDGSASNLLMFEGTIPINFRGAVYNIPINLWLPLEYPHKPPICFVVPTKDMEIKPKHLHVDSAGQCYLPYSHQWRGDTCNVAGLVYNLSLTFGQDPPVYSKPGAVPPPTFPPQPHHSQAHHSQPHPPQPHPQPHLPQNIPQQNYPVGYPGAMPPPQQMPMPPYFVPYQNGANLPHPPSQPPVPNGPQVMNGPQPPHNFQSPKPEPKEDHTPPNQPQTSQPPVNNSASAEGTSPVGTSNKPVTSKSGTAKSSQEIMSILSVRLQQSLDAVTKDVDKDIDRYTKLHQQLAKNAQETDDAILSFKDQLRMLEENSQIINQRTQELDQWLKTTKTLPFDVDEVTSTADSLSSQMFDLVSEDAALEDTLFYLTQALLDNKMDLEAYMKIHRSLARDQFAKRALAKKIFSMQRPRNGGYV
eukprot:TRINITY_DN4726_c0_g1_i2.p1 TRINITY_DN4726_c0_g1~~TRINITY_DN4726_c0_g1_i2.p1  ORF type:complete len:467 (+),score=80.44 TRINITY_DN4726_c0_g1_i2:147-1547(+)